MCIQLMPQYDKDLSYFFAVFFFFFFPKLVRIIQPFDP